MKIRRVEGVYQMQFNLKQESEKRKQEEHLKKENFSDALKRTRKKVIENKKL